MRGRGGEDERRVILVVGRMLRWWVWSVRCGVWWWQCRDEGERCRWVEAVVVWRAAGQLVGVDGVGRWAMRRKASEEMEARPGRAAAISGRIGRDNDIVCDGWSTLTPRSVQSNR